MRAILSVTLIFAALVALAMSPAASGFLNVDPDQFGRAIYGGTFAILIGSSLVWHYRGRLRRLFSDLLLWAGLLLGLLACYSYRFELAGLRDRIAGDLFPGSTMIGAGGEVVVTRRAGGNFVVNVQANRVTLPFEFDTGASTVVIRFEDAGRLGIATADLSFTDPISTANGRAVAAETSIQSMVVGNVRLRDVSALITRPGALHENLLGMSFLSRLESFSVSGDRLTLKGR